MKNVFREILDAIGLSLVVFILIQMSIQNFKVEGASMSPTLESGQYLIVNKLAYADLDFVRLSKLIPIWRVSNLENHNVRAPVRGERFPRRIYWVKFGQYIGRHLIGLFCISLQSPVDSFKGLSP